MERKYVANILLQKFWLRSKDLDYMVEMLLPPAAVRQNTPSIFFFFFSFEECAEVLL